MGVGASLRDINDREHLRGTDLVDFFLSLLVTVAHVVETVSFPFQVGADRRHETVSRALGVSTKTCKPETGLTSRMTLLVLRFVGESVPAFHFLRCGLDFWPSPLRVDDRQDFKLPG